MDISSEIAAIQAASQGSELRQPLVGALNKLNSGSLPAVSVSDAGKILKVGANGWEVGEKSGYMPIPTAIMQIDKDGTYDVTNYSSALVDVSGGGGGGGIPSEYQTVEYLQCLDGNASIPINVSIYDIIKYEIDLQLSSATTLSIISGARCLAVGVLNTGLLFVTNSSNSASSNISVDTNRHIITWNTQQGASQSVKLDDGSPAVLSLNHSNYDIYCYIFSGYTVNNGIGMHGKIYGVKVYDIDDCLIRDLVPCYRKLDSIPGLYDKIRGVFYTNIGNGVITVGQDV